MLMCDDYLFYKGYEKVIECDPYDFEYDNCTEFCRKFDTDINLYIDTGMYSCIDDSHVSSYGLYLDGIKYINEKILDKLNKAMFQARIDYETMKLFQEDPPLTTVSPKDLANTSIDISEITFKDVTEKLSYIKVVWNDNVVYDATTDDGGTLEDYEEFKKVYNDKIIYEMKLQVIASHHFILNIIGE